MNSETITRGATIMMPAEKKVTVMPATKSLYPERDRVKPTRSKKRVAAYCRVSTALEEQQGSYNLQQTYFEALIKSNPNWELAGVYGDEGKSGTTLKGRTGFLRMMDDVRVGKIDCIIAKATSRFGRNNSEFIAILDELDSYGVEVLFESEGILTSGQKDRTMLQIMGVANEHYSSTLSNNIRWSKERNIQKGKVTICYKSFLGYRKGADGNPEIVPEEAEIVRRIYDLFLMGKTYAFIARHLTEKGIPTPAGKDEWHGSIIKSILTNEKYTGDALLQKTFTRNYLDKKPRKNTGERPQVLIENNHPGIIDKGTFAKVQEMIKDRTVRHNNGTDKDPFVGRVFCADCGECYGHKTWTSRGRIKYEMWVCNYKYSDKTAYSDNRCTSANLRREWLEQGYLRTINQLLAQKSQILGKYGRKLKRIDTRLNSGRIEREIRKLIDKSKEIGEKIELMKVEWEFTFGDHTDYDARMNELDEDLREISRQIEALDHEKAELGIKKKTLETFIATIDNMPEKLTRFHNDDFVKTVRRVDVSAENLVFCFYSDESIKVKLDDIRR